MIRVVYVGHGTVQIEAGGTRLLTDPVLRGRIGYLGRIAAPPALDEIDHPDAVLISHAHFDHLDRRSLQLLRPCPAIAPRGCGRLLRRAGFRDVTEAVAGEPVRVGSVRVDPVTVSHDGRRHPFSRARDTFGYVIENGAARAFFAGDTDLFDGMSGLGGELDVALLPIWGWGPRVGRGHMDPARAATATARLRPRVVIPIHWGTIASPRAPWLDDPGRPAREFADQVAASAPGVEVRVLAPGERTEIAARPAGGSEPE
jgi:L-ascorbate metabolism protein UlaG (beta-lactamase superfamily)